MHIFFAGFGTDAGGIYWDGKKFRRVPGWNPEAMAELQVAVGLIRQAEKLKTPGLGETLAKGLSDFVGKELGEHMKEGGILVIG